MKKIAYRRALCIAQHFDRLFEAQVSMTGAEVNFPSGSEAKPQHKLILEWLVMDEDETELVDLLRNRIQ